MPLRTTIVVLALAGLVQAIEPAGFPVEETLCYNTGGKRTSTTCGDSSTGAGVRFAPQGGACRVIGSISDFAPVYPEPYPPQPCSVIVYSADESNGGPDERLGAVWSECGWNGWQYTDLSGEDISIADGDSFLIFYHQLVGNTIAYWGDIALDYPTRNWWKYGKWNNPLFVVFTVGNDFQLNAVVQYETGVTEVIGPAAGDTPVRVRSPARGMVRFSFTASRPGPVRLDVYDPVGTRIASESYGQLASREHALTWDCRSIRPGPYLYRLSLGSTAYTGKLLVLD